MLCLKFCFVAGSHIQGLLVLLSQSIEANGVAHTGISFAPQLWLVPFVALIHFVDYGEVVWIVFNTPQDILSRGLQLVARHRFI